VASSISNLLSGANSSNAAGAFTGLGQGIDVNTFVQLALGGDQANINNLQNQETGINTQSSALAVITSYLTALKSAASALNDPLGVVNSELAASSNSNAVTATASSTATAGTHTIAVTSLATTSSFYSDAVATSTTPLATGDTISISAGGVSVATVTVDSTNNTLTKIAAAINTQTTAVRASVINDANGARLAFVSAASGAPGNLAVTGSLHRIDTTAITFTQAVAGLNAVLTVDSVPISSTTNTVSNVINGVTLNLAGPTGGTPVTLTVAPDTSSIATSINQLVTSYNAAINAINAQFQVGANGTGGGPLEADGSLRQAQQALLGAITHSVAGSGGQVNLTNLGINVNNDGTLTVNSGGLSTALSSNFSGVQSFLQTASTGFAGNLNTVLISLTDSISGVLGLDANGLTQSSQALSQQVSDLQSAMAVKQQNLIAVYARVNTTLQELPLLQSQLSQQLATVPR
jgi:flagellar hook-associated protein 2